MSHTSKINQQNIFTLIQIEKGRTESKPHQNSAGQTSLSGICCTWCCDCYPALPIWPFWLELRVLSLVGSTCCLRVFWTDTSRTDPGHSLELKLHSHSSKHHCQKLPEGSWPFLSKAHCNKSPVKWQHSYCTVWHVETWQSSSWMPTLPSQTYFLKYGSQIFQFFSI